MLFIYCCAELEAKDAERWQGLTLGKHFSGFVEVQVADMQPGFNAKGNYWSI